METKENVFVLRVDRVTRETHRVITLRLRAESGDLPFRFQAGQHLGVRPRMASPEPWRHYSFSSSPELRDHMEITVLNQGRSSDALHGLVPGDRVETTRPAGSFVLDRSDDGGPVFFAAGIGAAPVRSMIRGTLDRGGDVPVTAFLLFSSPREALYLDQLQAWAGEKPRFTFWVGYSLADPSGKKQFLDPVFLAEQAGSIGERTCYLCLPHGLRGDLKTALKTVGVPEDRVRAESW